MNPYEAHAHRMNDTARREYSAWIGRMSTEERRRAKDLGVDHPPEDDCEVGGHSPWATTDLAESPLASIDFDLAVAIDTPAEHLAERFGVNVSQAKMVIRWHQSITKDALTRHVAQILGVIVGGLLSAKNPKLSAAGLAFAAGLDSLNGLGCQREYARNNNLSPSAVSKVVKAWQRSLGLRTSVHQKSEAACSTYSDLGKANHWRKQRITQTTASKLLSRIKANNNLSAN